MSITRRSVLAAGGMGLAFRNEALRILDRVASREGAPDDEDFWGQVRQAFALDPNFVNFNNGGCCPSPRVVQDALRRQTEYANQAPSYYMWQHLEPEIEAIRRRLAKSFGVESEEIAITRNASEALETCLLGYDLNPGDEVLTTNLDYPRMITTIQQRERREGIKMVEVDLPPVPPQGHRWALDPLLQATTDRTKFVLISHVAFLCGQILPVRAICEAFAKRNIPVIVDGAHAFAQFPFQQTDLGCEYYGVSLHKWLMAPVGTGMLFVAKERIGPLWPLMAATDKQVGDIRKFEEIGTHPAAIHNAIGEALTFHEMLGGERKAARLRYLRERWVRKVRDMDNVRFYTSLSKSDSCGITTVGLRNMVTADLQSHLMQKHGIYTVGVKLPHREPGETPWIDGIRVTPNVYTDVAEVDRFGDALAALAR